MYWRRWVGYDHGTKSQGNVHVAIVSHIAHAPPIGPPLILLKLIYDLHGPHLHASTCQGTTATSAVAEAQLGYRYMQVGVLMGYTWGTAGMPAGVQAGVLMGYTWDVAEVLAGVQPGVVLPL